MRLLPESINIFLINRLAELCGLLCLFFAFFIVISLFSYSALDPTIINFSSALNNNKAGSFGANMADFLIQIFGLVSYLIIIPL